MPQTLQQGDIFGRIGKSFGEGLSDQIPKELDRQRLSKALSNIQGVPKEVGEVVSAGGERLLPTLMPYIQDRRDREAVLGSNQTPSDSSTPSQSPASPLRYDREASNYLVRTDPSTLQKQAAEYSVKNNLPYSRALDLFEKRDEKRVQSEKDFEDRGQKSEAEFDKYLANDLQKSGSESFKSIIGEMQDDYRIKVRNLVDEGVNPIKAAKETARELLDFAKTRSSIQSSGRELFRFGKSPLEEIHAAAKKYREADASENLVNDLINYKKFSREIASAIAYPPSSQEKETFKSIKRAKGAFSDSVKTFKEVTDSIQPSDSMQTLAYELKNKGYDPQAFLSYARKNGKNLTARQEREFLDVGSFQPTIADIAYFTMSGRSPYEEEK